MMGPATKDFFDKCRTNWFIGFCWAEGDFFYRDDDGFTEVLFDIDRPMIFRVTLKQKHMVLDRCVGKKDITIRIPYSEMKLCNEKPSSKIKDVIRETRIV